MVQKHKQGGDIMAAHETVNRLAIQQAYAATAFPTDDWDVLLGLERLERLERMQVSARSRLFTPMIIA